MADIFDFPRDARNVARADGKGADMGGEAPQTMLMRPQGVPDQVWNAVLSVDCMTIPAASEHQEAAEMFINFMCETDIGKANAEYIGYTTPMHCVWDILDEDLKYSEIAYPSEDIAAKEEVFTALSDEVNSELDVKWSEMKSYDEGGSGYLFLMLLLAMLALACFNIWRKVRRKTRNMY